MYILLILFVVIIFIYMFCQNKSLNKVLEPYNDIVPYDISNEIYLCNNYACIERNLKRCMGWCGDEYSDRCKQKCLELATEQINDIKWNDLMLGETPRNAYQLITGKTVYNSGEIFDQTGEQVINSYVMDTPYTNCTVV